MPEKLKNFSLAVFLTAVVSYLDLITGFEMCFAVFYLIPIVLVTGRIGLISGATTAFICSILWYIMDYKSGHVYSQNYMGYWNATIRFLFFIMTAYGFDRLKRTVAAEKEKSKLNSEIISAISHEFNNLLTAMHLSSVILREGEGEMISEERKKFYRIFDQNYTTMRQDIRVFLNKSRLESGKLKLNIQETEIRKTINEVLDMFSLLTFEKDISIIRDFPDAVIPVSCDPDAISLVISNLISNAIKYSTKAGKIIISIDKTGSGTVRLSIKDEGIGIGKEDIEKILSGFYRTEAGRKHAQGFGIGLKLANELLEMHGSKLEIMSQKEKGSVFFFELPVS